MYLAIQKSKEIGQNFFNFLIYKNFCQKTKLLFALVARHFVDVAKILMPLKLLLYNIVSLKDSEVKLNLFIKLNKFYKTDSNLVFLVCEIHRIIGSKYKPSKNGFTLSFCQSLSNNNYPRIRSSTILPLMAATAAKRSKLKSIIFDFPSKSSLLN